ENGSVRAEIGRALVQLAVRDGKAEPAVVAALGDRLAVRRAAAAAALCAARAVDRLPAVRKLLADGDETVRLPVALALVKLGEKDAVPVLIAVMDREPSLTLGPAEDVLFHLAGEKSPHLASAAAEDRKRYREGWEAWWKASKE